MGCGMFHHLRFGMDDNAEQSDLTAADPVGRSELSVSPPGAHFSKL
jgi:hypothetical protein